MNIKILTNKEIIKEYPSIMKKKSNGFRRKLEILLNSQCENGSDTPDFILANFLIDSLKAFDNAVNLRTKWYKPKEKLEEI